MSAHLLEAAVPCICVSFFGATQSVDLRGDRQEPPAPGRTAPGLHGDERMATLEAECERLVGLGATRLHRDEPAPPTNAGYIVMADPEGNEFCLD